MINGMYISTMGAMSEASRHSVISNNLANANTTAFKPDVTTFREVLTESAMQTMSRREVNDLMEKTGGGAWLNATTPVFTHGPVTETGNPLNAAIRETDGFFTVERNGETFYTRDGSFTRNAFGQLTLADGITRVTDANGQPITLSTSAAILPDGAIQDTDTGTITGQIGLVHADNASRMVKMGGNLWAAGQANLQPGGVSLVQNSIEQSAVDPITEMAHMIEASRMHQANMTFIRIQDETLGQTVSRVGRIS